MHYMRDVLTCWNKLPEQVQMCTGWQPDIVHGFLFNAKVSFVEASRKEKEMGWGALICFSFEKKEIVQERPKQIQRCLRCSKRYYTHTPCNNLMCCGTGDGHYFQEGPPKNGVTYYFFFDVRDLKFARAHRTVYSWEHEAWVPEEYMGDPEEWWENLKGEL